MAAGIVQNPLTLEEFDRLYGDEKPYYEYWNGQAIQKPMPTLLHSLLQFVLMKIFREWGLTAGAEVRIKLSQEKQPLPDVISDERLQHPYPTKPFAIAVEILSSNTRTTGPVPFESRITPQPGYALGAPPEGQASSIVEGRRAAGPCALSPEDKMQRILRKCRFYAEQGIGAIYVFDPEDRTAQRWNAVSGNLESVTEIGVPNRSAIPVPAIWKALDEELKQTDLSS